MTSKLNLPNPSFADTSSYDSDDEELPSRASTSRSHAAPATQVSLGFDDGEIPAGPSEDGSDASVHTDESVLSVSRIGGRARFPLRDDELPPPSLSQCPICATPMPLLVQVHAPLTDDQVRTKLGAHHSRNLYREEVDRLLYVFGCSKRGCNGVRLLRAGRRNDAWASEGRKRRAREAEELERTEAAKAKERASNPFASGVSDNPFGSSTSNPFSGSTSAFGSMIFGDPAPAEDDSVPTAEPAVEGAEGASDDYDDQTDSLPTPWPQDSGEFASIPEVPARYLALSYETLSKSYTASSKQAQAAAKLAALSLGADGERREPHKGGRTGKTSSSASGKTSSSSQADSGEGGSWAAEGYEVMRLSGVEEVFLAFQERLEASQAASQVLRYEFAGTPLPFSAKSEPYRLLYADAAAMPGANVTVSRAAHAQPSATQGVKRYDPTCAKVDRCTFCGSRRTFEMQLMPNLVTILERAAAAGHGATTAEAAPLDFGWATVWCFTCEADCMDAKVGEDQAGSDLDWQGWREEVALVELED